MNDSVAIFRESKIRADSSDTNRDLPPDFFELRRDLNSISNRYSAGSFASSTDSDRSDDDLPLPPPFGFYDRCDLNGNVIDWRRKVILKSERNEIKFITSVQKMENIKTNFPEFPNHSKNIKILKYVKKRKQSEIIVML